jgi:3-deoxy-7-phosphoheptulonate synthase
VLAGVMPGANLVRAERLALERIRSALEPRSIDVLCEVLDPRDVATVAEHADMLEIGARNMQNFPLLREAGISGKPVLLKRGMAATVDEWLLAAEYVLVEGNPQVVLCESGIRSFDSAAPILLDLAAIPLLRTKTHLPVVVAPARNGATEAVVESLALAAIAAGADGLLLEPPAESRGLEDLAPMVRRLGEVARAVGRRLPGPGRAG